MADEFCLPPARGGEALVVTFCATFGIVRRGAAGCLQRRVMPMLLAMGSLGVWSLGTGWRVVQL